MQIEAPYVFDWENAIALHAMPGNRASSRGEEEVSWVFSSCGRHVGINKTHYSTPGTGSTMTLPTVLRMPTEAGKGKKALGDA